MAGVITTLREFFNDPPLTNVELKALGTDERKDLAEQIDALKE